jgi:hypothetical protein
MFNSNLTMILLKCKTVLFLFISIFLTICFFPDTICAEAICDNLTSVKGKYGYQPRINRCEGFYISTISAKSLEMVSLLKGPANFPLKDNTIIEVSADVSNLVTGDIHIRAVAKSVRTYYRMDASLQQGELFEWSAGEVLLPNKLSLDKLGILGWIESDKQEYFVPLKVKQKGGNHISNDIYLTIRARTDYGKIIYRVSETIEEGQQETSDWEKVADSLYTGRSLTFKIPSGDNAILEVEIAAIQQNTGKWSKLSLKILRE